MRPSEAYRARIERGEITPDPAQSRAVARLDDLAAELKSGAPGAPRRGLLARFSRTPPNAANADQPHGLYLHGPVGTGKSLLMDLFFEHARCEPKRRVHFHGFMLEVHRRLNQLRERGRGEPIRELAADVAAGARLLCFDEFVVQNIADAMILARLFEGLFAHGVVVVLTSNFPPGRLYEGGLNRDRFLPFIDLIEERLEVVEVDGGTDYRLARLRDMAVYHCPLGAETDARLERAFRVLADEAEGREQSLAVGTRRLTVPRAAHGVAWFGFEDLCARALGAADYLALTDRYDTLILSGVPKLTPDKRNEARRFITLVDALYERRTKLIIGADAPPEAIYASGDGAFEFQRTVSRLMEMQSRAYIEAGVARGAPSRDFGAFALTTDLT